MDDAQILALLSGIEPSEGEIPKPPFMAAIPAPPVIEAGADLDAVDAWVTARGGWTHRIPAHLAAPDGQREPLFYIVPKGHLQLRGAVAPSPVAPVPVRAPAAAPGAGAGGLGSASVMAFVATTDLPAARAFYGRALGLALSGQSPIACTFDANGTTLRVVAVEQVTVAPYTVLGWTVTDMVATVKELVERGVDFARVDGVEQNALGIWNAPGGTLVAWFKDPDGNMLSLTQF